MERFGYLKKDILEEICFPLEKNEIIKEKNDIVYLTGTIYTIIAKIYFRDEQGIILNEKEINNGNILEFISEDDLNKKKYFCVSLINDNEKFSINEVVFTIQLTSNKYMDFNKMIYPHLFPGLVYSYGLSEGETAIFTGDFTKLSQKINFNMKLMQGVPHMYFDFCGEYPNCHNGEINLENLISPNHSNKVTLYSFNIDLLKEDLSPISAFQPLLIINCLKGYSVEKDTSKICTFDISFFSQKDYILLKESESYSQYLLKEEKNFFTVSYEGYQNINKIYLDLVIFSGDVIFQLETNVKAEKYFISNKIFYVITIDNYLEPRKINFYVKGEKNSFYMVQYQLIFGEEESKYTNILESGINNIETIDINNKNFKSYKYMIFQNFKKYQNFPFLVNFYSQNCKFKVSREINENGEIKYKEIDLFDDYSQEIINQEDPNYFSDKYIYKIESESDSISEYNKKLCAIYVSGVELNDDLFYSPDDIDQGILVTDAIPQIFIFIKNNWIIKYTYHVANIHDNVIINFNLLDKTTYGVIVHIQENSYGYEIFRNDIIVINKDDLEMSCEENQICIIRIYIILEDTNINSRLETTISQTNEPPIYLEKNSLKDDILIGNNYKFYYLDIGKDQSGYVIADFKRGSGNIYGKIVEKNQREESTDADWRGFHFPKEKYLDYNSYLKKLIINETNTNFCENGCYLLITIQYYISEYYSEDDLRNHKISIIKILYI